MMLHRMSTAYVDQGNDILGHIMDTQSCQVQWGTLFIRLRKVVKLTIKLIGKISILSSSNKFTGMLIRKVRQINKKVDKEKLIKKVGQKSSSKEEES
jgi:hypothetical protein